MYYRCRYRGLKSEYYGIIQKWNGKMELKTLENLKLVKQQKIKRWHIQFGLFYLTVTSKSLVWFYYCFSTVLQYSNANRLQVEIRCTVGSGFKLSAKPCPQPLPVLFFNTRYKWVIGETLQYWSFCILFPASQPEMNARRLYGKKIVKFKRHVEMQ